MADSNTNIKKRSLRGAAKRAGRPANKSRRQPGGGAGTRRGDRPCDVPDLVPAARELLESLPIGAMVLDHDRRVVGVNAHLLSDLGLPENFVAPGETLAHMARDAALQGEPALIALVDTVAETRTAKAGTTAPVCEIVTKGGIQLEVRISPVQGGGFVVTLARRTGPAPAERLSMLDEILSHQRGAIFRRITHADGSVSFPYVSSGVNAILGVTPDELMSNGVDILSFVEPRERAELDEKIRAMNRIGGDIDFEFSVVTPANEKKAIRCAGRAHHDGNGNTIWDARITDIEWRMRAEGKHRSIRALLDKVVENIPYVVSVRSASDMKYILYNKAGEEIFGIKREDILGKSINGVFPEDEVKRRRERDRQIIETGEPMDFPESTISTSGNGRRIVKTRKFPLFDDNENVQYILSITQDVTDWRKAQEALERSEKRFRDIAESASDWFWETDEEMRFIGLTEDIAAAHPFDISRVNGKTRRQTALPADISEDPAKWAKYDDDVKNHRPIRNFVYRILGVNGKAGYVKVSGNPIFGDDGEFLGYRGAATHITAEMEAEAMIKQVQTQLLEAIECVNEGFALFDADDRLVMCNKQYADIWPGLENMAKPGITYREMVEATAELCDLPFGYPTLDSYVSERVAAHQNAPSTIEQQFHDGRWIEIAHVRTSDGGVVITVTDITAPKEREESLRRTSREALRAKETAEIASRAKSEFLANMSHELRTPLNAVIGFSEIIKEGLMGDAPNQDYREYAGDIHNSGKHLLELINDILDMSKIEAGKLDLVEDKLNIRSTIESCLVLVRERAEKSQITLEISVPDDMPKLLADLRKLKQILINLLSNSVKFTKPGGNVTISGRVADDGAIVLSVTDTGIGMKPDEIEKALEPFGQIDGGLNKSYEGTGLGLTLTKALVEMHRGRLEIISRTGEGATGTTVSAIFPLDRSLPG